MTTVTKQDILNWIEKQPDDRKINMLNTTLNDECGCVMIEYAKDNFEGVTDVGMTTWWHSHDNITFGVAILDEYLTSIIPDKHWTMIKTIKDLKAIL